MRRDTGRRTKRQRTRLAKAELWMDLAMTANQWKQMCGDTEPGTLPFAQWPADDPMVTLARTYDLTCADLARLWDELGDALEARAIRGGYADHDEPVAD